MDETPTRVMNPVTGGQKDSKLPQLFDAPPEALLELAKVYGYGAEKYSHHNYRKGYEWSLSYNALYRHLLASQRGEDIDPESGLAHMAHVAWHALALTQFLFDKRSGAHPPNLDDRFLVPVPVPVPDPMLNGRFGVDYVLVVESRDDHSTAHEQKVTHYHGGNCPAWTLDTVVVFNRGVGVAVTFEEWVRR